MVLICSVLAAWRYPAPGGRGSSCARIHSRVRSQWGHASPSGGHSAPNPYHSGPASPGKWRFPGKPEEQLSGPSPLLESPVPITGPDRGCCLAQEWGQVWPGSPPQESRPHPVGRRLCPVTDTASPTGPPKRTWGQFCLGPCALSPLSLEAFLDTPPPLSFPPQACAPGPSSRPSPHWASLICLSICSYLSLAIGCSELRSLLIGVVSAAEMHGFSQAILLPPRPLVHPADACLP